MSVLNRLDVLALFMGITFALIWSSAFSTAWIIVSEAPPMTALSARFLISGSIGVGLALLAGQKLHLESGQWRAIIVFGVCQNAIYLGVNFVAMQWIEASLAAIIASSLPLIVALINRLLFGERVSIVGIAGLSAGFAGVALILGTRMSGTFDLFGVVLCILGALALAIATLTVKNASAGGSLLLVVGLQMLVGFAILVIPAALFEELPTSLSLEFFAAFSYTTIVPGLIATWIWFTLVNRVGPTRAATYHFLNPFFGVAVAAVLLGESFGIKDVLGVIVVTAGIVAVQVDRTRIRGA